MSFLIDMAAEVGAEGAEKIFVRTTTVARERLSLADPSCVGVAVAASVLDTIEENKAELARLGGKGLVSMLAYAASGLEHDAARLVWFREDASVDDLINASLVSTEELLKRNLERKATRDSALSIVRAITMNGARVVLPFILGAL